MSLAMMVRISPKAKRIYLQRFLLSKFVFFRKELELRDLCCLFENQLWLERKCLSDPDFNSKFGKSLEDLSILLKEINFKTGTTDRALDRFARRLRENLADLVLPKRNYKEASRRCNGLFTLVDSTPQGKAKKAVPPASRIGIGYRDKGSAKDIAKDGSPSWQEVATHRGPLYHNGKEIPNVQIDSAIDTIADTVYDSIRRKK